MKKVFNHWLYIVAILPQFVFEDYLWITIIVILTGWISRYFLKDKRVFIKLFILELIVFATVFFIYNDRIFYLKGVLDNLELPTILLSITFLLFNALNISILFFTGYTLNSLILNKTKIITASDY